LHRDIKPKNIILGDDGVPRLVDFGLAVPVASEGLHAVAGSPPYMAPEQARGQGERVDARTDVYGLGAVLYYLLTGQPPHKGSTLNEVIEQARDTPVVPPREINPRVPRALERVCLKATAADPQSRFQSADTMRSALGRYMLLRRGTRVLGVFVIMLALVVSAWAFWSRPAHEVLKSEPKQGPQAALRVTRFEILLFPKRDVRYRLSEGAGLHAIALLVSRQPLPPYRAWKKQHGLIPWIAKLPCEPGVVWRDDDQGLQPLLADDPAGTRGKGFKARGSGGPVAKLASWLRALPGVDVVTVEAVPAEPATGP